MATGPTYSESEVIKRVERAFRPLRRRVKQALLPLGIGDDAALLRPRAGRDYLLSCDHFLEGVHFLAELHQPESVGYKALVRAASDLAAMGAEPVCFLLGLAIPGSRTGVWLNRCVKGMLQAARRLRIQLVGGDTSEHPTVAITIIIVGSIKSGHAIQRRQARPGDIICVTGRLGGAQLGLELLWGGSKGSLHGSLTRPHLYPPIRTEIGMWLARRRLPTAMIDVSDGLSTDLEHLCEASGVGARVYAERIPGVESPARNRSRFVGRVSAPLERALHGGEDYELLFTVPARNLRALRYVPGGVPITPIGEITREKRILLIGGDGEASPLVPRGWEHFSASRKDRLW